MKAIYGLYGDPQSAARAADSLREAAPELEIRTRQIVVLSSEPIEGYGLDDDYGGTPMPWLAALGGLAGGVGGYWLAAFTQKSYRLPTGGMPIVAAWTNGIISYEVAMVGAILATVLTLLVAARLPNCRRQLYDVEVSTGKILIGVTDPPEPSRLAIARKLRESGSSEVREV